MAVDRDAASWDERYARRSWPPDPSSTVVAAVSGLSPGRAVDLAGGPGRHALWLASRGWQVTSVDFSVVGSAQGRDADADGLVTWVVADVRDWEPAGAVDLVLVAYAQLGPAGLRRAGGWLSPGGRLVVVGHALRNLTDGVHGPRDPAHLQSEELLREGAEGLVVERLEEVLRPDQDGTVVELLLVARRPDEQDACSGRPGTAACVARPPALDPPLDRAVAPAAMSPSGSVGDVGARTRGGR